MVGKGFFGGLFDFDGDGKLDDFEKAADFAAFMSVLDDTGKNNNDEFEDEECGEDD